MSWQEYVDNQLLGTGCVSHSAICGFDGSVWAASEGLAEIIPEEVKTLIIGFNDASVLHASGLRINGKKYVYLSGSDSVIRAKSMDKGFGLHCVKTQQAVIISTYAEPIQPQQAATVVESLGDYLVKCGY